MGLLSKLFRAGDPWERVPQPYATALRARLTDDEFTRLTSLLGSYKQITDARFPADVAMRSAADIREHVAAQLLHLAFQFGETLEKLNRSAALRMPDVSNPAHQAVREALRLSVAVEPVGNPAAVLLPEYLLDAGLVDDAVGAAAAALPEWERRLGSDQPPSSFDSVTALDTVLAEFLSQSAGTVDIVRGLRAIAHRELTIRHWHDALTPSEYATLRASLANWLRQREILVDPNGDAIEAYPLRLAESARLSGWIAEQIGALREHFDALELLRVAHVLQPDFTNVNEVLADIYFRSQDGTPEDGDTALFRERAHRHATLAAAGMEEALATPEGLEGTGLTTAAMRERLARMQEILRALG